MTHSELQQKLRATLGLHVGDEMARYIIAKIAQGGKSVSILASDARTGQPLQRDLDAAAITSDSAMKRLRIRRAVNPMDRITAISLRRSRIDIAAVFAATSPMAVTMISPSAPASFIKMRNRPRILPMNTASESL